MGSPGREILQHVYQLLPSMATGVARKGREIKFVVSEPEVALSFVLTDPRARWAFIEQRVTLDRGELRGEPTGWVNLLHAANAINRHPLPLRRPSRHALPMPGDSAMTFDLSSDPGSDLRPGAPAAQTRPEPARRQP